MPNAVLLILILILTRTRLRRRRVEAVKNELQDAGVTLMDSDGNARTYTVPAGWTEDIALDGPPGFRTLDLTTLSDQPGFLTAATALQDEGFDAEAVIAMEIRLGGSGALDDLIYDPYP